MRWDRNAALGSVCALLAALALAAVEAAAQESDDAPPPSLDQLLKLPSGAAASTRVEKRGGSTKPQWQERFRGARHDLDQAQKELAETRAALEERMGQETGQWKMAAPGLGDVANSSPTDAPTDYALSQQMRRNKEEVERAERRLQDLKVEANLAGVPPDWRVEEGTE